MRMFSGFYKTARASFFLFTLLLMLGITTPVAAKGEAFIPEAITSWEDADFSLYEGKWVSTGLGVEVYLPLGYEEEEINSQEQEEGLILRLGDAKNNRTFTASLANLSRDASLMDIYADWFAMADYTWVSRLKVNGIEAVGFDEKDGVSGLAFLRPKGEMVLLAVYPTLEEEDREIAVNILLSMRKEKEEEGS